MASRHQMKTKAVPIAGARAALREVERQPRLRQFILALVRVAIGKQTERGQHG